MSILASRGLGHPEHPLRSTTTARQRGKLYHQVQCGCTARMDAVRGTAYSLLIGPEEKCLLIFWRSPLKFRAVCRKRKLPESPLQMVHLLLLPGGQKDKANKIGCRLDSFNQ